MEVVQQKEVSMLERFVASIVLAGVGDAIGYHNGAWEFEYSGIQVHKELKRKYGTTDDIEVESLTVSDDQVMHLATAEALVESQNAEEREDVYKALARHYVLSFDDMGGRAPGPTTGLSVSQLQRDTWDSIRYSPSGGGCGASMRSMCIGLFYCGEAQRDQLIAVAIESGRLTHNHPTGFFGSLVSALFTSYAIEGIPVVEWGRCLLRLLPRAYAYLKTMERDWGEYQKDLRVFERYWIEYLNLRCIAKDNENVPKFPEAYGVKERDAYYKSISYAGWGGASGHDSVIIAYDALLGAGNDFGELLKRGALHGGDSDSTGVIACSWWGAIHGFKGVSGKNYKKLEYRYRAQELGILFYKRHAERLGCNKDDKLPEDLIALPPKRGQDADLDVLMSEDSIDSDKTEEINKTSTGDKKEEH